MLKGKVVVITGSTSGVGFGTARAALEAGAKVFIHGPTAEAVEAASIALGGVPGIAVDLVHPYAGTDVIEGALTAYGRIDGVVNNAGIFPRQTLEQTDAAFFDRMFAINARSPLIVCQRAVKAFKAQGSGGSIVNIGSVNAYGGAPNLVSYSMSKGALMTMTRNLSNQLAQDLIRVNQLNLGWILTETEKEIQRLEGRPDNWWQDLPGHVVPIGRLLGPEDVAKHVVFWLSEQSAPVTGQVYEITQTPFLGRA
ncbi:MAG TPA: SDR family oxidoreductase [Devosiaceae bacterium]|jgi:NAD(P)-dependent dehydrogenase (short-subunit alcohol dehydrogenase family)|nr:SDR family oxidoreductase [Devosiaceae bacterium]